MSRESKQYLKVAAISSAVAVFVLLLSWQSYFNQINDAAYDFTLRVSGQIEPSSPTRIVAIDEESLDRVGAWPWRREVLARLIDRIAEQEPRVIGIDIVLDDPRDELGDFLLARSVKGAGNVVLSTRVDDSGGDPRWLKPLAALDGADVRLGHVHADPDLDGVIRRIVSAKEAGGEVFSALGVEVLRASGDLPKGFEQQVGSSVRVVPEPVLIRFSGDRQTFPHVPAWEVLEGYSSASALAGGIVLVGATAEGLGDDWMTSFSAAGRRMSGIEVHANLIETIFSGRQIQVVPDVFLLLGLVLLVAGLWWMEGRYEGRRFYVAALAMVPLTLGLSWLLMSAFTLWLPFPTFLTALVLVVPGLEVAKMVRVNRDLDEKIGRLSSWAAEEPIPADAGPDVRAQVLEQVDAGETRDRWLALLDAAEQEGRARRSRRQRLLDVVRRDSRWKLDAVDFFNEQLYRFLSFNNAILAGIDDVIIVSDPLGRVVYQNPSAERLSGYSQTPPPAWEYLSGLLDGRRLIDDFAAVFARGEPRRLEFVPSGDRSRFYTMVLSPIIDIGIVASVHDVTAQHELNQAKNDMVSLVSHELRTPLTSIQGYSEMLVKYGLVEEKGSEFLGSIIGESRRLNELIQSFLDIAYIESGRQKLNLSEFAIAPVLDDLLRTHDPVARKKGIAVAVTAADDAGLVRADRMLLYQALANLVSNAIKYSPSGTAVRIAGSNGDGRARFIVEDEGYGIPPEDTARIFEKFFRRGNKETRDESGFGLGLAFVKEVALRHGGDVTVESEPGKGSVFSLWIPN